MASEPSNVFSVDRRGPEPTPEALDAAAELGVSEHYLQIVTAGAHLEMTHESGIYVAIWHPEHLVEMNVAHDIAASMPDAVAVGDLDWAFLFESPKGVIATDPGDLGFEGAEYICENLQDLIDGDLGDWRKSFRAACD